MWITSIHFVSKKLLEGDLRRLWLALVKAADFNLLLVLHDFLKVVIGRGKFRQQAHRAALAHNVGVYRLQEKWEALAATQSELQKIIEHEARIALLKAQQESADRVAKAAEREAEAAEREARAAEREAEAAVAEKKNPPKVEVVVVRDEPACPTPRVVTRKPRPPPPP